LEPRSNCRSFARLHLHCSQRARLKANYQDLGGGDLQDEVYAAKFLESTGYVDPKRIGITGGSYGGFMTLMAIGRTPDV
jgi:dipeptidyl aminopeptidase/acylaminoacyl peptidase